MGCAGETNSAADAAVHTESDALRMLDVVRRLNTIADAQTLLDALAEAVAETTGYRVAVVSLDDPFDGDAPGIDSLGPLRLAEQLLEIGGNFLHARLFEAELRESEERYRRLVDTSPDGILVSVDGRLVFANRALAAMLGI